jgi:type II secretory pathway component PulF
MLRHVARYSNEDFTRRVKRLSAILEPAIIVPVAVFVTLIIASMLMPYFKLIESIR